MEFGHVHFPVSDLARSVSFYRDLLGLRVGFELEGTMAEFEEVSLVLDQRRPDALPSHVTLGVSVEDVDSVYEELVERGVEIAEPLQDRPWGVRNFYVRDPDGYLIEFDQPLERSA